MYLFLELILSDNEEEYGKEDEEEDEEDEDEEDDDEILYDIADTLEDIAEHNVTIIASLAEIKAKVSKMDEIYEILKRIEMNTRKDA